MLIGIVAGPLLIGLLIVAASGSPDPTDAATDLSPVTAAVNASIIVFREGLEAVLILAAVTASFLGKRQGYRRPVLLGAFGALAAGVVTWFVAQAVLGVFSAYGDVLQAVTGLLAIGVLLVVMNWFFHKMYWTEWIGKHNRHKRELVERTEAGGSAGVATAGALWGFVVLGFTSVYRESFEVVLFLQNLQLKAGSAVVLNGVLIGLAGTIGVGVITFALQHKLPYKRMLIGTGILLGVVLVVMVGGTARTLQDLEWIPTTGLGVAFPDWWARWFELVPTVETILFQLVAVAFVVGSYYLAEHLAKRRRDAIAMPSRTAHAPRPAVSNPTVDADRVPARSATAAAVRVLDGCPTHSLLARIGASRSADDHRTPLPRLELPTFEIRDRPPAPTPDARPLAGFRPVDLRTGGADRATRDSHPDARDSTEAPPTCFEFPTFELRLPQL